MGVVGEMSNAFDDPNEPPPQSRCFDWSSTATTPSCISPRNGAMALEVDVLVTVRGVGGDVLFGPQRLPRRSAVQEAREKLKRSKLSLTGRDFVHVELVHEGGPLTDDYAPEGTAFECTGIMVDHAVLQPSAKGTEAMKKKIRDEHGNSMLWPAHQKLTEATYTCIAFGQERRRRAYILLATCSRDGDMAVFKCYRTEMELAALASEDFPDSAEDCHMEDPEDPVLSLHSTMDHVERHTRAITSMTFSPTEDQLVSTSIDMTMRVWDVDTGTALQVFSDGSPVFSANFLPFCPSTIVLANRKVLRLVNVQNGHVLQKVRPKAEVTEVRFDHTGYVMFAGTVAGSIDAYQAAAEPAPRSIRCVISATIAKGRVTSITFVRPAHGQPPCLLVNHVDSRASIVDCIYDGASLTGFAVRFTVSVKHTQLPLRGCYCPSGQGYFISGSEDKDVHIFSLARGSVGDRYVLKCHQAPVIAVAVNQQNTLLASADSLGRLVLWRRMDFPADCGDQILSD